MKNINTYINERLHITTKSHLQHYTYHPKTTEELQEIIIQRIKDDGPECDLNDIDVSKITDMSYLFSANTQWYGNEIFKDFNCDISRWDVSNVEYMDRMFSWCEKFNCDLSNWNVLNVKDIEYMFNNCKNFNQNLNNWDVSNVKIMKNAFYNCPTTPKWYEKRRWEY